MKNKILLFAFAMILLIGFTSAIDITNCTGLQDINLDVTESYTLMNDIDCSDTVNWNSQDGFLPISWGFEGVFDGNGFKIMNLYINRPDDYQALFSNLAGSIINVGLVNVSVTGNDNSGGLVGASEGGSLINNSFVTGRVSGNGQVGGLVGDSSGTISRSYSDADVYGSNLGIGGLVGVTEGGEITNSYSSGSVNGSSYVGGLVGYDVVSVTITNSYSSGSVNGSSDLGGLVGYSSGTPSCINSFWDVETSGQETSVCGTGKTTIEMKTKSTFVDAGWDLINTWGQNSITLYPALRYQSNVADYISSSSNLIQGSGTIYDTMKSSGAGLGKFLQYMTLSIPFLVIGLAIVGIVITIALGLSFILKGFMKKR